MKNLVYLLALFLAFGCQQNPNQQQEQPAKDPAADNTTAAEAFKSLFEEVNVVKMHLFATNESSPNAENYPYVGKPIGTEMAQFLPEGVQANAAGGVFACYRTENSGHYILRVPGKNASSDLLLCKWDGQAAKLKSITPLASIQCDGGTCYQMDSWLTDLDDNRLLELITRSHKRDDKGNITEETFEVTTDDGSGSFTKSDEKLASLAVKSNYVMQ